MKSLSAERIHSIPMSDNYFYNYSGLELYYNTKRVIYWPTIAVLRVEILNQLRAQLRLLYA